MRSILVVPVGNATQVDRAFAAGADALVLDLSCDGDAPARDAARHSARDILRSAQIDAHRPHLYVRLAGLDDAGFDADLAAVMIGEPDGVLLARSRSGVDVQHLGAKLAVQEAEYGLSDGETGIIAEAATNARALFGLGSYGDASPRLVGLTWHAAGLAADLGSDDAGDLTHGTPLHTARHLTLFAARAADVAAIDTISLTPDDAAFRAGCEEARRHGFNGKMTTLVDQIATINAVFSRE